jgi:hypothetical protein
VVLNVAVMPRAPPGLIATGGLFWLRPDVFGSARCVGLMEALALSWPRCADLASGTFEVPAGPSITNGILLWNIPQWRRRLSVLRVTCLVRQKAVSAMPGSFRFGATRADDARRLCGVMRFAFLMASSS